MQKKRNYIHLPSNWLLISFWVFFKSLCAETLTIDPFTINVVLCSFAGQIENFAKVLVGRLLNDLHEMSN